MRTVSVLSHQVVAAVISGCGGRKCCPAAGKMDELATATYLPEAMQSQVDRHLHHLVDLGGRSPRLSESGASLL